MEEAEKEEEEYLVESIVTHLEYVDAFELRGYIVFNPQTGNGTTHSKYVYLVKWFGYPDSDNTWEPEENLVDCTEVLTIYKQKHGLPLYHETFKRQFNWREPTTSLTLEEVNRLAFKNRDPITSASQLVRDPPTKQKRKAKEALPDFVVDSDDDAEYVPNKKPKRPPTIPVKVEQEVKRKRGPKPFRQRRASVDGPPKKVNKKPRSASNPTKSDLVKATNKGRKKNDTESHIDVIRYVFEGGSRRSRSPVKRLLNSRRYSSAERLPERWFNAIEEGAREECSRMTREKLTKIITARFAASSENIPQRQQMIVSMRERDATAEEEARQYRVVGSSLLKKLLKEHDVSCKLPVISIPVPEPVKSDSDEIAEFLRKLDENRESGDCETVHLNADVRRTECSLAELRKYASEQSLEDSVTFLKAIREKDATLSDNDLLTIALSYAELFYKLTIRMLKSVPDVQKRFDLIKELVGKVRIFGNSNISRPEEPSTSSSSLEFQLIESELSDGGWLGSVSHCSAAHWKCRLMYGLMSICPSPEVFTDESSPFNQQNFLHCMRYGAHCQKLAFIRCGVPYGSATIDCDLLDVRIGSSHIAAMQGNPRYLFEFILHGFDMNALTSRTSPGTVDADMTVSELLTSLAKSGSECINGMVKAMTPSANLISAKAALNLSTEDRKSLSNICAILADWNRCMVNFVQDNVQKKLICDQHCEVVFDQAISPVHTIRVSAASTECGVRTVLFGSVPTPLIFRILGTVFKEKSAVVLCVYSVSVVYVPRSGASSDEFPLPLGLKRIVSPGCAIKEASLYDECQKYTCALVLDTSSTSDSEWYFVLDVESLKHISTNTTTLHLNVSASPGTIFLAQFVLVTRKDFDEMDSL